MTSIFYRYRDNNPFIRPSLYLDKISCELSPYLTGMRQVRDGFANRFAKPSRTVAKRSHGIAKSSHASQTRCEQFAKVFTCNIFCATKIIAKPSPSDPVCGEPVANPSQTHRKEVFAICTMQQICDIKRPFRDLITTVLRHSRESLTTVVPMSSI